MTGKRWTPLSNKADPFPGGNDQPVTGKGEAFELPLDPLNLLSAEKFSFRNILQILLKEEQDHETSIKNSMEPMGCFLFYFWFMTS